MPTPPRAAPVAPAVLERLTHRAGAWRRVAIAGAVVAVAVVLALAVDWIADPSDVDGRGAAFALTLWDVPRLAVVPDPTHPDATVLARAYLAAVAMTVAALIARTVLLRRVARLRPPSRTTDPRTRRRARRARDKARRRRRREPRA